MEYLIYDSLPGFLSVQLAETPLIFFSILYIHVTVIITPELVPSNSPEDVFLFSKKESDYKLQSLLHCFGIFFFLSPFTTKVLSTVLKGLKVWHLFFQVIPKNKILKGIIMSNVEEQMWKWAVVIYILLLLITINIYS